MKKIDLNKTDFQTEDDLKNYLTSLVLEYASTMNKIEEEICLKEQNQPEKDFFPEFKKLYLPVFEKYCSEKRRIYGGKADSFGIPTKFDGIEKHTECSVDLKNKNRAEVYFKTDNDEDAEYLFVLFRKSNIWRIDNAKVRWYEEEKWDTVIL